MSYSPFPGPTPPWQNPPIESQNFQPRVYEISAITLGTTTTVTTSVNQDYVLGQQVRLLIPFGYGTRQLNQRTGNVIDIPALNQVTLDIFSIGYDPFINANFLNKPQIAAIGDINNGLISYTGRNQPTTTIPGSFQNISGGNL